MTTRIKNLGRLDATQLKQLYLGSHIEKQIPQSLWVSIVDGLALTYPDWFLFTQDVYAVEFPEFTLYMQDNVISVINGTGPGPLCCDIILEQHIPLSEEQIVWMFENFATATGGRGCYFTNVYAPNVLTDKHLEGSSSIMEYAKKDSIDSYIGKLTSKKRNSVKKSLAASDGYGLRFKRLVSFTQEQLTWLHMTLLRNFASEGTTEDNAYSVEFAQVQWAALLGSMKNPDFYVVGVFNPQDVLVGAIGLTRRIPINNEYRNDTGVHYDFTSYVQNHAYNGISSAVLLNAVSLLADKWYQDVTVTLSTAVPPGTDYDYFLYKRNCSTTRQAAVSMLATHVDAERIYPCSFDSKQGEWKL